MEGVPCGAPEGWAGGYSPSCGAWGVEWREQLTREGGDPLKKSTLLVALVAVFVLSITAVAQAFLESGGVRFGAGWNVNLYTSGQCSDCHGRNATGGRSAYTGPHGGYTDLTDKCGSCHDVHEAVSTNKLLPAATVFEVCNTCHDLSYQTSGNEGGHGVYGAIRARGQVALSRHNIYGYNNTDTAPSDGSTGYADVSLIPGSNNSLPETLTCTSCHTPHGNTEIAAFKSERVRRNSSSGTFDVSQTTNKLLRDDFDLDSGNVAGYTNYGSSWCAACHNRRHDEAPLVNNHPTDNTAPYLDAAQAGSPSVGNTSTAWHTWVSGDATFPAGRQAGWSREATEGWQPICQQCHYNSRDVESPYSITSADGTVTTDNPQFQTYPHETDTQWLLVETGDDLCLNCHSTTALP
jgi:predicted CXXCH cytochrome family protein